MSCTLLMKLSLPIHKTKERKYFLGNGDSLPDPGYSKRDHVFVAHLFFV